MAFNICLFIYVISFIFQSTFRIFTFWVLISTQSVFLFNSFLWHLKHFSWQNFKVILLFSHLEIVGKSRSMFVHNLCFFFIYDLVFMHNILALYKSEFYRKHSLVQYSSYSISIFDISSVFRKSGVLSEKQNERIPNPIEEIVLFCL